MKVAYIAGKYTADTIRNTVLNIRKAEEVAIKYINLGFAVICPHTNTALLDGAISWEAVMDMDYELVRRSDVVVFLDNWKDSRGAKLEHALALELNKQIIYE